MKKEKTVKVGGMHCVRCAAAVENALKSKEGVYSCAVSYANGRAEIAFDDSLIGEKDIAKAVKKAGYYVVEDAASARKREFRTALTVFIFSLVFALPFFVMMAMMPFCDMDSSPFFAFLHNKWFQFALATPIQLVAGWRFYRGAVRSVINKSPSMDLLVALGTTASYAYSVYAVFAGKETLYFESSAMILTLVLLGRMLESRARVRTGAAIEKLMDLSPKKAFVIRDGIEIEIPVSELVAGEIVAVRPGGSLPADGTVVEGSTEIDESMLTGESMPVAKTGGDRVFGGTVNGKGFITFRAENVGEGTVLSGIIRMVEQAQSSKASVQNIADKVSAFFVPAVAFIAVITFVIAYLCIDGANALESALERAVAVLVIACPCSLGLATPTALIVGIGRGANMGILIKDADALEKACRIKAVVFDKTGTVTEGRPALANIITFGGMEIDDALSLAAAAESRSEHPLASVIVNAYDGNVPSCSEFGSVTGSGVYAVVSGKNIKVGKPEWAADSLDGNVTAIVSDLEKEGKTVMLLAVEGVPAAVIAVSDPVKKDSADAIGRLKNIGVVPVMVTGDNEFTAQAVAAEIGIKDCYAGVLPDGKLGMIEELKEKYKTVAMAGDGINDAPALAKADVGFAMGNGTDIAIESGDVVLVGGISALPDALLLSRATMRKIKQNLFWAFFYNTVGIPLAAAGLLTPVIAGAAMAFSSVSVVTNSLLLRRVKLK
ncbi:MAG: cadmium-translocating P-type ATPase [Clostridia bacterium]|nr:cadmium-translocating P-type ATPase [Clostridia bacterium]